MKDITRNTTQNVSQELLKEDGTNDWDQEELKHVVDQFPEFVCNKDSKYIAKKTSYTRPQSLSSSDSSVKYKSKFKNNSSGNEIRDAHSSSSTEGLLSDEIIRTPVDLNTPDPLIDSVFDGELDWESENSTPVTPVAPIPTYSAREEYEDNKAWKTVHIGDKDYKLDLKVIEPYKKILSHGGYYGDGLNALVIFTGCYLPDKSRRDYHYVMDNLFLYVINTLELLVVEDYMIVYFHGTANKNRTPGLRWLKRCYEMIDRRLRKNLKGLLIVHPTIWFKTVILMIKPFISAKFAAKIHYVKNLENLKEMVPTEQIYIPDEIKNYDALVTKSSSTPQGFL